MDSTFKIPTEIVELPSQGLVYPESSPLSSGKIEISIMTEIFIQFIKFLFGIPF